RYSVGQNIKGGRKTGPSSLIGRLREDRRRRRTLAPDGETIDGLNLIRVQGAVVKRDLVNLAFEERKKGCHGMVADAQRFARGQIARLDRRIEKQNSLAIHEHSPSAGRASIYCQGDMM